MRELVTSYSALSFEFLPIEHLLNTTCLESVTKLFLEVDLSEDGGSSGFVVVAHHGLQLRLLSVPLILGLVSHD